jgi:hypothetical protein
MIRGKFLISRTTMVKSTREADSDTASEEDEVVGKRAEKTSLIDEHSLKSSEVKLEEEPSSDGRYLN